MGLGLTAIIAGCASSTGVVPIGQDSYMISKRGGSAFTSAGSLKADVFTEANEFCDKKGRKLFGLREGTLDGGIGVYPRAELEFMCLAPGDPNLKKAAYSAQ